MFNMQSIRKLINSPYLLCFLFGLSGSAMLFIFSNFFTIPQKKVITIQITRLIDDFVKSEIRKNADKEQLEIETKNYAKKIEKNLKLFSEKYNFIILPKEALLAGGTDYTEFFAHEFNQT